MTAMEIISKNIARLMDERNVSQTELARRVGCSRVTINGYLSGRMRISMEMIGSIAAALDVEEAEVLSAEVISPELQRKSLSDTTAALLQLMDVVRRVPLNVLIDLGRLLPEELETIADVARRFIEARAPISTAEAKASLDKLRTRG